MLTSLYWCLWTLVECSLTIRGFIFSEEEKDVKELSLEQLSTLSPSNKKTLWTILIHYNLNIQREVRWNVFICYISYTF